MRVDLLVVNAVYHNFLPNPQITFPMLQSTVEMESSSYCSQTIGTTSFNIAETFVYIPII